jgi:transcriptional regulator with XRE-family HTH domain
MHFLKEWMEYRGRISIRKLHLRLEYEPGVELISTSALGRIVSGENQSIDPEVLFALAEALDCGPEDILTVNPLKEPEVVDLMAAVRRIREMRDPKAVQQATRNLQAVA